MALYFFDLYECGIIDIDGDGMEAGDLESARVLAVTAARDVMCGDLSRGELCLSCHIEIRDEAGRTVDRVLFRDAVRISGLTS